MGETNLAKAVSALYGAIVGVLVPLLYEFLKNVGHWSASAALLASTNAGIVVLMFYELVVSSHFARRRLSPLRRVEGPWSIKIEN